MSSLFEELEAREAAARVRVEELETELAGFVGQLEQSRKGLDRLRIARETVAEVMAEMSVGAGPVAEVADDDRTPSPYAGAERRVVGALSVPKWQAGMDASVLPRVYRDILEVATDAPGPARAEQVVPWIGLPAEVGKIEGTRAKLKRLVERRWLDEDDPGLFTPGRRRART
ncbi:hypothetical protein ABT124_33845 [Streptomyces sp. NPDC001982]|uniref:hypothetical protein n=1 Tax=Streptomyces sp. NPDC001982 TaxID=3154405 RepID=UPI003320F92D